MTAAVTVAQSGSPSVSLGFKNRIINGDMRIDQRNAGASVNTNNTYPVDRFNQYMSGGGVLTSQQSSTAPTGFVNSLYTTVSTADSSIAAGDYYFLRHIVEGLNVADLGWGTASASTVTLSFQVRSSVTGTFGGAFVNSAEDRSYPFTYTISAANTWETKTITVAGDTSGTWLKTNGIGIRIVFDLGSGSTRQGTAGAWAGAGYTTATGCTQLVSTLNATFYITGVQLEKGSTATPFDYRPYGTELALCQRYFQKSVPVWGTPRSGDNYVHSGAYFKTTMRVSPTLTLAYNQYGQTISIQDQDKEYYVIGAQTGASSSVNVKYDASAEL